MRILMLCTVLALTAIAAPALAQDFEQLTFSTAMDRQPSWSPDGTSIVFESNRSGISQVHRLDLASGDIEQLTFGTVQTIHPELSPDGTRLVYVHFYPEDVFYSSQLIVRSVDGGPETVLDTQVGAIINNPTWSPDGDHIYYELGSILDLMRVPSTGGTVEPYLQPGGDANSVRISKDGLRSAFALRESSSQPFNIYEGSIDDPESAVPITFFPNNTGQADYSPDGSFLIFASRNTSGKQELFELEFATGDMTQITFDGNTQSAPFNQMPVYSPDGSRVAFSSARMDGNENIWIYERVIIDPPEDNVLTVGNGQGIPFPGGEGDEALVESWGTIPINVLLSSTEASPALELRIDDLPDVLEVVEATTTGRAASLTVSFSEDEGTHLLIYSPRGARIPPGRGEILRLSVRVIEGTELGTEATITPNGIVFSDVDGNALDIEGVAGTFLVARKPGDVNGDNRVNVGDLVRLVEIILGLGNPPHADEIDAADCNADETVNALDIVCLQEAINDDDSGPVPMFAGTTGMLRIQADAPVHGLEILIPASGDLDLSPEAIYPLQMQEVRSAAGNRFLLFDPAGGAWETGRSVSLGENVEALGIRAFGPGGKPLAANQDGNVICLGGIALPGLTLLPPFPNPTRGSLSIGFTLDEPAPVSAQFFDVRGALVDQIPETPFSVGSHSLNWDSGRADSRLPGGVYFARVKAGDRIQTTRVILLNQ